MIFTDKKLMPISFDFLPMGLDIADWESIKSICEDLCASNPQTPDELIALLEKASELRKALEDELSWRYIRMTLNADDESYSEAYNDFYSKVFAQTEPYRFQLQKIFWESPHRLKLNASEYGHLISIIENEIKLFREENIPLNINESELANNYGSIISQMTAEIDGEEKTVAQLSVYLKDQDRSKREKAWRLRMACYQSQETELNKLYDELKSLRVQIAKNADMPNYRDFMHKYKGRFSYSPEDLQTFHRSVEKVVVPFVTEMHEHRKKVLGLDTLRPWDLAVDLDGRTLKPFENTEEFIDKAIKILGSVKPEYAIQLEMMNNTGLLDLENRKGKAPGGYNTGINKLASSFIFMNHVKLHNDVVTLLHESGHAMHSTSTKNIKLDYYCD
ncbi:MAG: M3 family metallopeptidase, partial [Candidatus Cloacimonadaceae bacterium]|nr:M3 family metallopeptidase [Candidatus Cloacimonadaceae bacterium]